MRFYEQKNQKQLELFENGSLKSQPAKRVSIVSLKLVRESSMHYRERRIKSPTDAYQLLRDFLIINGACHHSKYVERLRRDKTLRGFSFGSNKLLLNRKIKIISLMYTK